MAGVNLIVAADEPAIFFASVRDAERSMEPVDVEDGVYTAAFGPNGEPYSISTDGRRVTINRTACAPKPDALKSLLIGYFTTIGSPLDGDETLQQLMDLCSPS